MAFTILISCEKEQQVADEDLCQTWEAITFISVESVVYPKHENSPVLLTFNKDGTYNLELDINSCGGSFEISNKNQISIESPVCTETCCDSPFSIKLANTLSKVTTYSIEDHTLQLNVPKWGFIELEVVE